MDPTKEKAKADKPKPDKTKADKPKPEKATKADKPKAAAVKAKPDKAKTEKPKADKVKGNKSKDGKDKALKPKTTKPKPHKEPVNKKRYYKPNPILKKKRSVKKGRVTKKKEKITKVGKLRYGRKKREIIRKIMKPHVKKADDTGKKVPIYITKSIGGEKNGGTRTVLVKKPPAYYPTEVRRKRRPAQKKQYPCKLKSTLVPGTVCIVLAGPHKGKRVVFLKQLQSGLCLVTGPFTLNKCPLRRINQIYVIGTSTKIDLGEDFKVPDNINDDYFKRVKLVTKKHKKDEGDIFTTKAKKYFASAVKKADQKTVDVNVLKAMKKRRDRKSLFAYMSTKFSLRNHQFPHLLKF